MKTIIEGGTLVNEGSTSCADLILENDRIVAIIPRHTEESDRMISALKSEGCRILPAEGCLIFPGAIDDQVHFREPGLTHKGSIAEGSRAAAAGGVTSFMDMPNVVPPTTTVALLEQKQEIAARTSLVNYAFYLGATRHNLDEIKRADPHTTCGVKAFMGSSTGNMLIDAPDALERLFAESPLLIATHCEDTPTINANLAHYRSIYGEDIPPRCHPLIRSREACLRSSTLAAELARKFGSRLHILHLSTAEEIALLDRGPLPEKQITGEACVHHLWFNDKAYDRQGNLVRWNPAIKNESDRLALLDAVNQGLIDVVATDHAPHTLSEKTGPYMQAASGGPMVQHSLAVMLELAHRGETTYEKVAESMCHAPARLFGIEERGFLRTGYKADLCIVEKREWKVEKSNLLYACGWSPLEGETFHHRVRTTIVNGCIVFDNDTFTEESQGGELLRFSGNRGIKA